MTTYFIADLHLSEQRPDLTKLFVDFMQNKAINAEAIYILGDLFDFWIGDDENSELISLVQDQIRTLQERGIPCYFIHGNRDFLIGEKFAKNCGLILLKDYEVIDLYGCKTLICHGDTLCIDDFAYQKFRRKVHQKWLQRLFLCLPLKLRIRIAEKIRQKSRLDKQIKPKDIMDVNADFVAKTMQQFAVTRLIHGHTHRQNIHQEKSGTRIVLGDWGKTASILVITPTEYFFEN